MNYLFLHHNYPGQFRELINLLASDPSNSIYFVCNTNFTVADTRSNIYIHSLSSNSSPFPAPSSTQQLIANATRFRKALQSIPKNLRQQPFRVISHSAWGVGVYVKDLFPNCVFATYLEWWFKSSDSEFTYTDNSYPFLKPYPQSFVDKQPLRNVTQALELASCDFCIAPTNYQATGLPKSFLNKTHVVYDIVRSDILKPNKVRLSKHIPKKLTISYCARGLEPIRGFPEFIIALTDILPEYNVDVSIIGEPKYFYGSPPSKDFHPIKWAQSELSSRNLLSRVTFHKRLAYNDYLEIISSSDLHFYLSRPFVPSWSLLETMSTGSNLIVSNTPGCLELVHKNTNTVDLLHQNSIVEVSKNLIENLLTTSKLDFYIQNGLPQRKLIKDRHGPEKQLTRLLSLFQNYS